MRVVVTGGTGLIGRSLVAALSARGDDVSVVTRHARPTTNGGASAAHTVGWDALEPQVGSADAIVHLAGEPIADARWTAERLARIRSSRVDTTAAIARAIAAAGAKPRVWISGSAIGIYGLHGGSMATADETAPAGEDVLARICVDWERAADPARSAGVRVVHARTGVVLSTEGGMLAKLLPVFRWGLGGSLGSGAQWVSWVHVRDVVRALLFAIDRDAIDGAVNVASPEPATMDDFARTLARVLSRPSLFRVPGFALRGALGPGLAEVLLTGPRATPACLLSAGFSFDFAHLEAALRDLVGSR